MIKASSIPQLQNRNRRSFLWSLAAIGASASLTTRALALKSREDSETVYRIRTPECDVQMSVEYFARSEVNSLRFRDFLSHRAFCLSPDGKEDDGCAQQFSGPIAIAHYRFRTHRHLPAPRNLRERVLTIDHDVRLDPRPPFEKLLSLQGGTASDIQAFGNSPEAPDATALPLWCLLRQDLFLNNESSAFLIVHWKHTFDAIRLLDVIPGDRTELVQA